MSDKPKRIPDYDRSLIQLASALQNGQFKMVQISEQKYKELSHDDELNTIREDLLKRAGLLSDKENLSRISLSSKNYPAGTEYYIVVSPARQVKANAS